MELRLWRHFDFWLLAVTALLVLYGLAMVFSATLTREPRVPWEDPVYRHAAYAAMGLASLLVVARMDYQLLGNIVWFLYGGNLALLGLALALGRMSYGAQRWLEVGVLPLQPGELSKLIIIVALAKYLADREEAMDRLGTVVGSLALVGLPGLLIFLQPHLGTVVLAAAVWFSMLVMAGLKGRHGLLLLLGGLAAAPLVWLSLHPYMRDRLLTFLYPQRDPWGTGYNIRQAIISVGSGGFVGQGFASGTQSQLNFLPVQYSDFIFSVLAEELGFVGALVLLVLLAFFLWRSLRVALLAADTFGRLTATGIWALVLVQSFINIGMNIGLLPVAGVTLPFISYGGSSLITTLVAVGLLQSIVMRHKRYEFQP